MDYILAVHPGQIKTFTFSVPKELVSHLKAGMPVLVETKKGLAIAITQTAPFCGDGAADVAKMLGAYEPIKPVVGFVSASVYDYVAKDIAKRGRIVIDSAYLCVEDKKNEADPVF